MITGKKFDITSDIQEYLTNTKPTNESYDGIERTIV